MVVDTAVKLHGSSASVFVCFQDYKSTSSIAEQVDTSKIKPQASPVRSEGRK